MAVGRGHAQVGGDEGQGHRRRQVLRLFRLRPAHQGHALAPRARHAARPQRGHPLPRSRRGARGGQAPSRGGQDQGRLQPRRPRPSRRCLAGRDRAARLEVEARPSLESDLLARLKERADAEAISVFSKNLNDLLLAAPAGPRVTMGLDPGFRTGVKVAVVDQTGKLVDTDTIYPHEPKNDWRGALADARRPVHEAQGRPRQRRQRHGQPRDRQARRRADRQDAATEAHQGDGVGGRRLGLFRLRAGGQRVPQPRCQPARGRLHRPAPAGPAGRARQDRAEGDRRRPVPARRRPGRPRPLARCGGGGLRQLGRRRRQHGLRAAARARLRPQQDAGLQHRRLPRQQRRLQGAHGPEEGAASRPQGLRAGGGLPAHHGRQEPARCVAPSIPRPIPWSRRFPRRPSGR